MHGPAVILRSMTRICSNVQMCMIFCISSTNFLALLEKSVFFPFKIPKHLVLEMQNVMYIAPNAGHTGQNDGGTLQNDGRTTCNVGRNKHNVYQGPKGGLEEPSSALGDPFISSKLI